MQRLMVNNLLTPLNKPINVPAVGEEEDHAAGRVIVARHRFRLALICDRQRSHVLNRKGTCRYQRGLGVQVFGHLCVKGGEGGGRDKGEEGETAERGEGGARREK